MAFFKFLFIFNVFWTIITPQIIPVHNFFTANTKLQIHRYKRSQDCYKIDLKILDEKLTLCLFIFDRIDAISDNSTKIELFANEKNTKCNLTDLKLQIIDGYIENKNEYNAVKGYLKNGNFYGKIFIEEKTYYVEDLNNYGNLTINSVHRKQNAIIYEGATENLLFDYTQYMNQKRVNFKNYKNKTNIMKYYYSPNINNVNIHEGDYISKDFAINNIDKFNSVKEQQIYRGYICNLLVIIDASFLELVAFNDVNTAISIALASLENANIVFRSTDFDGDGIPDNIGLRVVHIVVEGQQNDLGVSKFIKPYSSKSIDGKLYLNQLTRFPYLSRYCLAVAFTAQTFLERVIGLSYTAMTSSDKSIDSLGGICESINGIDENFNCLVVTYAMENGIRTPQFMADLSLVHELGHSFGSNHDDDVDCKGHVMTSNTDFADGLFFSDCSRKQIKETLQARSSCFQKVYEPFCGNGVVEAGEECDCGHPTFCYNLDKCCHPAGFKGAQCKVNRKSGFECHPSQGMCCLETCKFRNVTQHDLNCKENKKTCPCTAPSSLCSCGLQGTCIGHECHNVECSRIGLKECNCPYSNNAKNTCQTCCSYEDTCTSAVKITTELMEQNPKMTFDTINQFKDLHFSKNSSPNDYFKLFCYDGTCVSVPFKIYSENDFCVSRGELGKCSTGRCVGAFVGIRPNVFPRLEMIKQYQVGNFACTMKYSPFFIIIVNCIMMVL